MANEIADKGQPAAEDGAGVRRRGLLRLGTSVTAILGATAISARGATNAHAAPGDKPTPNSYVPLAEKGAPSGVAVLDGHAKIPPTQLPDLSVTYASKSVLNVKDFGALGDGVTNDTTAINAALASMVAGDTLLFPKGRYMTNGGHVVDKPSVKIIGASGRAQTYNSSAQLYLRNGANTDMITISANQVTVRDLTLYGNYPGQTAPSRGIVTPSTSGANYLLLDAVWVDSFNGDGYVFESLATLSSTIMNCESRVNRGYGMKFTGTATDSMVANCYIDQNHQSGVYCSAGDVSLTSVHIWGNGTNTTGDVDGITFRSSAGCRVVNCYIESQHNGAGIRFKTGANQGHIIQGCDIWSNGLQGIYGFNASNVTINGNVIRTNNYKGGSKSSGAGITLDSCSGMSITGNNFYNIGANRQTYGYYEVGTANAGNVFMGNVSRASQHTAGNWVIVTGTATPTMPTTPESYNAG